jgi:LSD1 subclass zinc finger protein
MINAEPHELRCNACGAKLHYEPGAAVLTCAHCGTEYVLDVPGEFTIEFEAEDDEGAPAGPEAAAAEPPSYEAEVLSWLQRGNKIEAIKIVRAHTGLGLRESKVYVEELAAREGVALPAARTGPCLAIVAATLILAVAGLVSFLILAR